jgi:hypothetical protein
MMKEAGMRPSDPCPVATTVFPQNPNCDEFFGRPRPGINRMTDHLEALESPKLGRRRARYRNAAGDSAYRSQKPPRRHRNQRDPRSVSMTTT